LDELGIHRVTLAVDSFHDSHEACVAAIRQAAFSRRGPSVYVLPPAAVHGTWQSWQQGRVANAESLETLLSAHRIHGFHYLALSLIAIHKGEGPWTDAARRAALGEARKFYAAAHQRNVPQLDTFFLPPLLEALGLNWGDRSAWLDSWLEDTPSSNGSTWVDHTPARNGPQDGESRERFAAEPANREEAPRDLTADDKIVLESVVGKPILSRHPPIVASPHLGRPDASDYCDFHHCERIVCLCWD
jgi:hypothetical protein